MAQVPYEFLVRWDHETGLLKGAHVKLYDTATMRESDAQPVALAGSLGFPLTDILSAIQIGSIAALDAANAELATTRQELERVKSDKQVFSQI